MLCRWILAFTLLSFFAAIEAFDPLDPNGNITVKWDIISWTGDGYTATVTMVNYQQYRHIELPGWRVGWTWAKKEVIWNMVGAQATLQGDCSKFKYSVPHCCLKTPTIVDLMPGVPYSQQVANCCRGGVLSSMGQDPKRAVGAFQVTVGRSGTTNKTVVPPKNFTIMTPAPGYTCGPAYIVKNTLFPTPDGRRFTQALMTWNYTCVYSQSLAQKSPSCCVSLSSFYDEDIVSCPKCSCGCQSNMTGQILAQKKSETQPLCTDPSDAYTAAATKATSSTGVDVPKLLYCSQDMCPIKVHFHVKINYKEYWRAKITITNRHARNYSDWSLVLQHPNLNNLTESFSFVSKFLTPYPTANDSVMFTGIKFYNDFLMEAGDYGNIQSEILMRKDASFTLSKGWAFPHRVLFNGDECVMPSADQYPMLPNGIEKLKVGLLIPFALAALALAFLA